jgi:hypothetical protein
VLVVVQEPLEEAAVIVRDRAAMVVLDFFDGVPVTVRQSPTVTALTVSVTVLENVVPAVQLTVVWAVVLCTSMEEAAREATLPLDPPPGPVGALAAPALGAMSARARMPERAVPVRSRHWRAIRTARAGTGVEFIRFGMVKRFSLLVCMTSGAEGYSLRKASMGARWAARLAG